MGENRKGRTKAGEKMEGERGRRLFPPLCLAPLPKLLSHRGDESGLECPARALEFSGIHSPPG